MATGSFLIVDSDVLINLARSAGGNAAGQSTDPGIETLNLINQYASANGQTVIVTDAVEQETVSDTGFLNDKAISSWLTTNNIESSPTDIGPLIAERGRLAN